MRHGYVFWEIKKSAAAARKPRTGAGQGAAAHQGRREDNPSAPRRVRHKGGVDDELERRVAGAVVDCEEGHGAGSLAPPLPHRRQGQERHAGVALAFLIQIRWLGEQGAVRSG